MILGPRFSRRDQFGLGLRNRNRVFAMRRHDHAQLFGQFQGLKQFFIVDSKGTLVRQKNLERRQTSFDQFTQLAFDFGIKTSHAHVEGIVDGGQVFGFRFPKLKCLDRIVCSRRATHFDQSCRSTDQSRLAGRLVVVLGVGAHERQVDMNMRVNKSGKHQFPGSINGFDGIIVDLQVGSDGRDRFIGHMDIGHVVVGGRDNSPVFDQQRHSVFPD